MHNTVGDRHAFTASILHSHTYCHLHAAYTRAALGSALYRFLHTKGLPKSYSDLNPKGSYAVYSLAQ
jgi:hypothetical protein